VFIEVGANDGVVQSNTYFLGRRRGWTGLLIEPVPWLAKTARRWRPEAIVAEVCATSPELAGKPIEFIDLDLVSQIGLTSEHADLISAPRDAMHAQTKFCVQTSTLTELLEVNNLTRIDFLSIDVEGHEMEVLAGLDLRRCRPTLILVETSDPISVRNLLSSRYQFVSALSHHDYLFQRRFATVSSSDEDETR